MYEVNGFYLKKCYRNINTKRLLKKKIEYLKKKETLKRSHEIMENSERMTPYPHVTEVIILVYSIQGYKHKKLVFFLKKCIRSYYVACWLPTSFSL